MYTLLDRVEKWLIIMLTLIMIFLVSLQVLNRFIFHLSISWTEEAARYIFVWVVFISASYAVHQNAHIGVQIIVNRLNKKWKKLFIFIMYISCLSFSLFVIVGGIRIVLMQKAMAQLSPAMGIPMYFPYLALPCGGALMFFRFVQQCKKQLFY